MQGKPRNGNSKSAWTGLLAKRDPDRNAPVFRNASVDAAGAVLGALGSAALVFILLYRFAGPITNANRLEFVKTALTITGFIGFVLAALYGYRNQRISEADSHRADAAAFTMRFTTASEQLGHQTAAVRLAGIYAMARLADDWAEQRQTCVDVLCAYLRMPGGDAPDEQEVRESIVEIIQNRTDRIGRKTWQEVNFNFARVRFRSLVFEGCVFREPVSFVGASFEGLRFPVCRFEQGVDFSEAVFSGDVSFRNSLFMSYAIFDDAKFEGSNADFVGTNFHGEVSFNLSELGEGASHFSRSRFDFGGSWFPGGVSFDGRIFESSVEFKFAKFGEDVSFQGVRFLSEVSFENASREEGSFISEEKVEFPSEFKGERPLFPNASFH